MKRLITLLILILPIITSCNRTEVIEKDFTIRMQKVNGTWTTKTYTLPDDAFFFIDTYRGSYSLKCKRRSDTRFQIANHSTIIRNGIIDYELQNN